MKTIFGELDGGTTAPRPRITCSVPEGDHSGIGLIILPGGAYSHLAEHEGLGYAQHFAAAGVACFVVEYRLGSQGFRHPAPLEDAQAALRTVRLRAAEFGVLPRKLGIMGSSAGGHLAAHTLTAWPRTDLGAALRPDFGVLCYPVITMNGPHTHQGCRSLLAGPDAPDAILAELSCERHVTAETPPCFIWHTAQDRSVPVENSLDFAAALRRNGVPFELHVYARGGHGLGLRAPFNWAADCRRWLDQITAA